jgi:phosphorylcholine metabolism protein LicD
MLSLSEHKEKSLEVLKLTLGVFEKLEIPVTYFLGTALGFYRDNDFCPGDVDDIDLAVDKKYFDRLEDLTREMNNVGISAGYRYIHEDEKCPEICFQVQHGNETEYTKVDIFFIEDNCWRFYFDHDTMEHQTRKLSKNYFTGHKFPEPIEEYLTENYGDWKTPISRENFTWHLDNKVTLL